MKEFKGTAKILCKWLMRTLSGTAVSATIALAVYGYASIPGDGGYLAVCEFVLATATLGVALGFVYFIGGGKKKKGGFEK